MTDEVQPESAVNPEDSLPIVNSWICPNGFDSRELLPKHGLPMELGEIVYSEHILRPGMKLFVYEANLTSQLTVSSEIITQEPYLWLPVLLSGGGKFRHGRKLAGVGSAEKTFLGLVRDPLTEFEHWTGQPLSSVELLLTVSRLREMLNGQKVPGLIGALMNNDLDPTAVAANISPIMRRVADQIRHNPYQGPMAAVYLEGKVFELLAELLDLMAEKGEPRCRVLSARRQAMAARDIMLADPANPPRIEDVARRVGLSQRSLNELFHDQFGASPLQIMMQWRLDKARLLLSRGDLMVKQVAFMMGYTHVGNFTQAYTRRFGEPPSRHGAGSAQLEMDVGSHSVATGQE